MQEKYSPGHPPQSPTPIRSGRRAAQRYSRRVRHTSGCLGACRTEVSPDNAFVLIERHPGAGFSTPR